MGAGRFRHPPRRTTLPGDAGRIGCLVLRFAPVLSVLCVVPMVVGFATGDEATGWTLLPFAGLMAAGAVATRRFAPPEDASEAEDAIAVALAFPLAMIVSGAPYLAHELGLLDAAFESMSGVTSTGLTRYGEIAEQPYGIHFLRAWQEWIGGYVIVTLTVALLSRGSKGAAKMAESDVAEDEGRDGDETPNLTVRSRWVTLAYAVLTVVCVLAVWTTGQSFGFSVLHGLTAISTGGFAAQDDSLGSVAPLTVWMLMAFSVFGAVALSDYVRPFHHGEGLRKLLATLAALVLLCALGGYGVLLAEGGEASAHEAFQIAASAQTTTGFSVPTVSEMTDASKLIMTAQMFVGGDVGSTAGGVKLMRLFALFVIAFAVLRPSGQVTDQKREEASDAVKLVAWWAGITLLGWIGLVVIGHAPVDALFEWTSALNNVGLSAGVSSGEGVPASTRLLMILAMWLGRVEILAALLVFKALLRRS